MALKFHPDLQSGNEARFKKIVEAYEAILDYRKRKVSINQLSTEEKQALYEHLKAKAQAKAKEKAHQRAAKLRHEKVLEQNKAYRTAIYCCNKGSFCGRSLSSRGIVFFFFRRRISIHSRRRLCHIHENPGQCHSSTRFCEVLVSVDEWSRFNHNSRQSEGATGWSPPRQPPFQATEQKTSFQE